MAKAGITAVFALCATSPAAGGRYKLVKTSESTVSGDGSCQWLSSVSNKVPFLGSEEYNVQESRFDGVLRLMQSGRNGLVSREGKQLLQNRLGRLELFPMSCSSSTSLPKPRQGAQCTPHEAQMCSTELPCCVRGSPDPGALPLETTPADHASSLPLRCC